jgi:hypothetical protein
MYKQYLLIAGLFFLALTGKSAENTVNESYETTRNSLVEEKIINDSESKNAFFDKKEWTILLFIQARNNLAPFAIQNLRALTNSGIPNHINLVIQWEQPNKKGVFRYIVEGNQLVEKFNNPCEINTHKPLERITSAFDWAIEKYPSRKVGVILWNHGYAGIDPHWGNAVRLPMFLENQHLSQKAEIEGLTHLSNAQHRAAMFDEEAKVYLSTEASIQAFAHMSNKIKRKLDFIGYDACFMSSIEMWSLLHPFAEIAIGSSEIELATGWNYGGLMKLLGNKKNSSAHDIAHAVVSTYNQYYNGKTHFHAQTAIELCKVPPIKENLNHVSQKLILYMDIFGSKFKQLVIKARKASLEFANPMFIDLHSFYDELYKQLASTQLIKGTQAQTHFTSLQPAPGLYNPAHDTPEIRELKELLLLGKKLIDESIISHAASARLSRSGGYGIYFPCRDFYDTYSTGVFSKISTWPSFIKKFHLMTQDREFSSLL